MPFTTTIKNALNYVFAPVNLRIGTLTAERRETNRIRRLMRVGQFSNPAYPIFAGLQNFDPNPLCSAFEAFRADVGALMKGGISPGFYDPSNAYFKSPDAEVLYLIVRTFAPRRIVEIGSGNSTRIVRQAIADGRLEAEHIAIDPNPRSDIAGMVDKMHLNHFEDTEANNIFCSLESRDIVFIDSSHEVRVANDVAKLFCVTIPSLASGVIVHVHDIFLPFDYPEPFCTRFPHWGEQYLLHVLLLGQGYQVLWPGYYVQKMRPDLQRALPFLGGGTAQSFWFRRS